MLTEWREAGDCPKGPNRFAVLLVCASKEIISTLKDKETSWLNKIQACGVTAFHNVLTLFLVSCSFNFVKMQATTRESELVKKVAIVGPECTGKTDLAQFLATQFKTEWVPEYARAFLDKLNRPYNQSDLTKIAHGQIRMEDEWIQTAKKVLICDTNLMVIKIWSEERFGNCDPEILQIIQSRHYDLLLLTDIDVPWEEDPQREHPDKREYFRDRYLKETTDAKVPFVTISGLREAREKKAQEAIQKILN